MMTEPDSRASLPLVSTEAVTERHLVSLPDPTAGGLEGLLGQANLRRLRDAHARVASIVAPEVLLPGSGSEAGHGATIDVALDVTEDELWQAITTVAHHDDLRPGRIAFGLSAAEDGVDDQLPFASTYGLFRPNLGAVTAKAAAGAAVIVHGLDWQVPALGDLVTDLETIGGRPCSSGAVVLCGHAAHIETADRTADVLLLAVGAPFSVGAYDGAGAFVVEQGHGVIARAGRDLTITASGSAALVARFDLPVAHPWDDVLQASVTARFHPLLRSDLPTSLERPIESYEGTLYDDLSKWRAEVESALGPTAHDHAAALSRALIAPRANPSVGLLTAVDFRHNPSGAIRSPAHAGVMVTRLAGTLHSVAGGGIVTFPDGAAEAVAPFLDGRPTTVEHVLGALEEAGIAADSAREALVEMVHIELLEPVP